MRHALALALVLSLPLCAAAGIEDPEDQIINGEAISTDEFPSAGQLIFGGTIDMWGMTMEVTQPMCTATLIAPDVLLSASHCVEEFFITFGMGELIDPIYCISFEADLSWMADIDTYQGNPPLPEDAVCSSAWVQHPDWDVEQLMTSHAVGLGNWYDLSLIFLDEVVDRPYAYLPDEEEGQQLYEQMEVDIVGYGQRDPEPMDPWNPDPEAAYKRYWAHTFINELDQYEMQIGSDNTTGRKCHGDSGGPTYVDVETDLSVTQRVIGVTTRAYSAKEDCNIGGIDMRTDAFLDWIDEEMRAACEDGTRVWCDEPGILRPDEATGDDDDSAAGDDDDTLAGDDDIDSGDDDSAEDDGCSCRVGPARIAAPGALLLLGIGLLLRRR
jgi:MYXO-CTERM domain-containing protein